jgi:hypothetical protein
MMLNLISTIKFGIAVMMAAVIRVAGSSISYAQATSLQ